MGKSSKKSATKVEAAAPAVIKATKPLKKVKREPEDDNDLEPKANLKRQKKDVVEQIEAKVDLLVTKADKKLPATKKPATAANNGFVKAKADSSSSSEDESSSSDEEPAKKPCASAKPAADDTSSSEDESEDDSEDDKAAPSTTSKAASSSDSDSDSESDEDETPALKMAPTVESDGRFQFLGGGRWPLGPRFRGGRCGGLGLCRFC